MNSASQSILQAVDILTDSKISRLAFDKTIQGQIVKIVNLDLGEYKVKYDGNIFSAFVADLNTKYKVDDNVYVVVPEGDFSKKKIITAPVTSKSLSYIQLTSLQNQIVEISPTFDVYYKYDPKQSYGVIAGAPTSSASSHTAIYPNAQHPAIDYHGQFQQYANNYELIRIQASFLTNFHSIHTKGNYGIRVTFYTKTNEEGQERSEISFQLDVNSFNGDPYNFRVYSPQSVVLKTQKNYLLGIKSIELFEEGFEYDSYVINGVVDPGRRNTTIPNIFAKDILIQYVEQRDLTDTMYYCNIAAPKGNSLTSNVASIDLVAQLIYQGQQIISEDNCKCRWFRRDLTVKVGDQAYDKEAGFGWRQVGKENSFGTLILTGPSNKTDADKQVHHQAKYKLIVTYNNKVNVSAEIEVFNLLSGYSYEVEQVTQGDDLKLRIKNVLTGSTLTAFENAYNAIVSTIGISDIERQRRISQLYDQYYYNLVGDWYLSYPDGAYVELQQAKKLNSIAVQDYLLYSSVVFYCQIYDTAKTKVIGTLEYTIVNSDSADNVTISYIGQDTYRYNANGDVTIEDSEKERTLQVALAWKDGIGTNYRLEWLGPDGKRLTGTGYDPENSMIQNLWLDNSNILHYTIKQKYKINYNDNVIKIRVITIDEQVYEFSKELLFVKDGDQGTNGTTYVVAIRPCDSDFNKLSGFQPLIYNAGWKNRVRLCCYVYKDGELINENSNYTITYDWNDAHWNGGINITATGTNKAYSKLVQGATAINTASPTKDLEFYVKVKVTIKETTNGNNRENVIYTSYPLDVAVGGIDISAIDISDIPSYVKYTSSGIEPSFYSNNINFYYNYQPLNAKIKSLNTQVIKITKDRNDNYYINPATSFIFEATSNNNSTIGLIKCEYTATQYIIHPIIMYLDTYGNEALNGWDGTKLSIDEKNGQYIYAPQVGAGIKNSDNTFTGVVMGQDVQKLVGLYGYYYGINTFGLTANGNAYFGVKGYSGRIEIDSTNGNIYSGNYYQADGKTKANQGMMIELSKGHIDSHNFYITSKNMVLDSGDGSFQFRLGESGDNTDQDKNRQNSKFDIYFKTGTGWNQGSAKKSVFFIDNDNYYLQSRDFCTTIDHKTGTKIDLQNGKITSYSFNLDTPTLKIRSSSVTLDDNTDTNQRGYFEFDVKNGGSFVIKDTTDKTGKKQSVLFSVTGTTSTTTVGSYYLQTTDFSTTDRTGMKINLTEGKITSYSFNLETDVLKIRSSTVANGEGTDSNKYGYFEFDVKNTGSFLIKDTTTGVTGKTQNNLLYIAGASGSSKGTYYLQTVDFSTTNKKGAKLDLTNGKLTCYNFNLTTPALTIQSCYKSDTYGNVLDNGESVTGDNAYGVFSFNVLNGGRFQITDGTNKLLYIQGGSNPTAGATGDGGNGDLVGTANAGSFYLQSRSYSPSAKTGTRIDLVNGRITSYDFTLKTNNITMSSGNTNGSGVFTIDVKNDGRFQIQDTSQSTYGRNNILMNVSGSTYYLQSANFKNNNGDITGVYINLSSGTSYFGGTITADAGKIGGWTISASGLTSAQGNTRIYSNGYIYCDYLNSDGGKIGGWSINTSGLYNGQTQIYNNGSVWLGGGNFIIDSSGNVYMNGRISATSGTIGGWIISATQLRGGKTILSSTSGIKTNQMEISGTYQASGDNPDNPNDDSFSGSLGTVGFVQGEDTEGATYNLGLKTTGSDHSIILSSARNIALRCTSNGGLWINCGSIHCNVPAASQNGIYARFA